MGIDAETLEIRAIEVTSNRVGDAQVLPDMLNQITRDERIDSVSGDGAYDTKNAHTSIVERDAEAIIPVRKNGKPWKEIRQGLKSEMKRYVPRNG